MVKQRNKKRFPFSMLKKGALGLAMAGMLAITPFAISGCGEKGDPGKDGKNGSMWYTGLDVNLFEELGVVGDFFFDTDDSTIYQKTTSGWAEIANIKGRPGNDGVVPTITINSDGYWVIGGFITNVLATAEDGDTPYIKDGKWWIDNYDTGVFATGPEGKSAFDLYKEIYPNYKGTEADWLASLKGKDGKDGAMWYTGLDVALYEYVGVLGDFFFDTDDCTIYQKTSAGWVEIANIKGEPGDDAVAPTVTINTDGYWVIAGTSTGVKATGAAGNTPYIKNGNWWIDDYDTTVAATGQNGKSAYDLYKEANPTYTGTEAEWLASLKGEKGDPGKNGAMWYTGLDVEEYEDIGVEGDFFFDTDDCTIYQKTSTGWVEIANIKGEPGDDAVAPTVSINTDGYWVIAGTSTTVKATGAAGNTPYIKNGNWWIDDYDTTVAATGQNGKSAFDLYKEANPTYTGTEAEWLASLKGEKGDPGDPGKDGSTWLTGTLITGTGSSISATVTGAKVSDLYLNTDTCDLYVCTADNTWKWLSNIKGDSGDVGSSGTIWHHGTEDPTSSIGSKGDYYFETDSGNVWFYDTDGWDVISNLKGPQGDTPQLGVDALTWHIGTDVIQSGDGVSLSESDTIKVGDLYLNESTFDVYKRNTNGHTNWWEYYFNLKGDEKVLGTMDNPILFSDFKNVNYSQDGIVLKMIDDVVVSGDINNYCVFGSFNGTLLGNNHTIIMPTVSYRGYGYLFEEVNGRIQDLSLRFNNIVNQEITFATQTTKGVVFSDISLEGSIQVAESNTCANYSPLINFIGANATFHNCVNNMDISGVKYGAALVGGYVLKGSKTTVDSFGNPSSYTTEGFIDDVTVTFENCVNNGNLNMESASFLWGNSTFLPLPQNLIVENCINNGSIVGTYQAALFCALVDDGGGSNEDHINGLLSMNEIADDNFSGNGTCFVNRLEGFTLSQGMTLTVPSWTDYTYKLVLNVLLYREGGGSTQVTATVDITEETYDTMFYLGGFGHYKYVDKGHLDTLTIDGRKQYDDREITEATVVVNSGMSAKLHIIMTDYPDYTSRRCYYYIEMEDADTVDYYVNPDRVPGKMSRDISVYAYDKDGNVVGQTTLSKTYAYE